MTCNCGKSKAVFKLHGGRFGEAGDHVACDMCLPDQIRWLLQHPKEPKLVEVRLLDEVA